MEEGYIMDWAILLYISALVAAVAFAVLVIFLVRTLRSANRTLEHTANTVANLEKQVNGITSETEQLLHKTNRLADDIQQKTEAVNTLFTSVKDLGQSVTQFNQSIRQVSNTVSSQTVEQSENIAKAVNWGTTALDLYTKFKLRKQTLDEPIKTQGGINHGRH